ncbi:DUF4251 domain-containing protein [Elizabethkingia sp. JS20170427COW]|uniref:DUF4251 domain-containing protein n=1 Tax=Elizabethkingia sp. JS20170427COW TaxID=2583851 RepID=UPI001110BA7F|nr:DUF4251 domain-containing protein [Elizabethkingia sp. JS20170427COW]QCX53230.1 DUF4251 domain-containing protein [Elizabethkingia sp. JS20170427COW]
MKKIFYITTALFLGSFITQSCTSSQVAVPVTQSYEELNTSLQNKEFAFVATKAYPTDLSSLNAMNRLKPAGAVFRLLDLDYGYGFKLRGRELKADLPFFGRMYQTSMSPDLNGIKFDSKQAWVEITTTKKKTVISIKPTDISRIDKMYLEVYPNGRAYLSIDSNDRQPISFDGYITKIPESRK